MASLKIHPPITHSLVQSNRISPISELIKSSCRLSVSKRRESSHRVCSSSSYSCGEVVKGNEKTEALSSGNLDQWIEESMVDIVKNLKKAPLLVQVYAENNESIKIKTERAVADDWPVVKSEWESGEKRSPDGLIFVEELDKSALKSELESESEEGDNTKAWGIVIQGRGVECSPACYLLKTSRVGAGYGMGLFCTHFCLARVQNFRESALGQFKNSWLLQ